MIDYFFKVTGNHKDVHFLSFTEALKWCGKSKGTHTITFGTTYFCKVFTTNKGVRWTKFKRITSNTRFRQITWFPSIKVLYGKRWTRVIPWLNKDNHKSKSLRGVYSWIDEV